MKQLGIYEVLNTYHLFLEENTNKDGKTTYLISTAESPEKLYPKAFDLVGEEKKKEFNLLTKTKHSPLNYVTQQRNRVEQEEELALCVGKSYLRQGDQQRATYFFSRANLLYQQRAVLEKEFLSLMGLNISQANFVNPVQL